MYLGILNIFRGIFDSWFQQDYPEEKIIRNDDHSYHRGNINDRGPCPALNALANQGFLPRDGKNLTPSRVKNTLMATLHMDSPLASSLSRSLQPLCRKDGTFDLFDMRRHNILEHDVSFTRFDFHQGDNYTLQPALYKALLDDAQGGPVTIKSLARTYIRRHKESKASGAPSLPLNLWFVNLLQTVSLMNTAQTGGKLSKELLDIFYLEERIPDEILSNPKTRTLFGLISSAVLLLFYVVF